MSISLRKHAAMFLAATFTVGSMATFGAAALEQPTAVLSSTLNHSVGTVLTSAEISNAQQAMAKAKASALKAQQDAAKKAQEEAAKKAKAEAAKRAAEEAAKKEAEIKAAATKTAYNQLVASASAARPVAYSTTYLASDAIKANALDADVIYACGPTPMLRALKAYAQEQDIECWISMEERMACGIGACLACVCQSKEVDDHSHVHNKRVCKDGPVFLATEVEL